MFRSLNYSPTLFSYYADALVRFLPPGEEFEELRPGEETVSYFEGLVLLGLGCYCNEPPDCNARRLQGADADSFDQLYLVKFEGENFGITFEEPTPAADDCTGFFLFCWIQGFIAFLLSLIGL